MQLFFPPSRAGLICVCSLPCVDLVRCARPSHHRESLPSTLRSKPKRPNKKVCSRQIQASSLFVSPRIWRKKHNEETEAVDTKNEINTHTKENIREKEVQIGLVFGAYAASY